MKKIFDQPLKQRQSCPHCGAKIDGAIGKAIATVGAPLVCYSCLNISVFDNNLQLRKPNITEHERYMNDAPLQAILRRIRDIKNQKP